MKTHRWTLPLLACAGLWTCAAWASVAVRLSLAELSVDAERVVVAQLVRSQAAWDADGRRIFTSHEFHVEQELAGAGPDTFHLVQPGGAVGRLAQVAHGYPTFRAGESVLLFLQPRAPGSDELRVVGLSQGVFALVAGAGGARLRQRLEGLSFQGASAEPLELGWQEALEGIRAARRAAGVEP